MPDFDEDLCMRSSYQLLLGKKTVDELLDEHEVLYFIHNPSRPAIVMIDDIYDTLIEYFTSTEEYEKCAEILAKKRCS
tara:strand:- start:4242 stop:4475 length:234 start_codon:yes stop_codon:yes gene_type:complete